jgi:hypothetical protein
MLRDGEEEQREEMRVLEAARQQQQRYRVTHDGRFQDFTAAEVLAAAMEKKSEGNSCFKRAGFTGQNEDYRWAAKRYTEGIRLLNEMEGVGKTDRWARAAGGDVAAVTTAPGVQAGDAKIEGEEPKGGNSDGCDDDDDGEDDVIDLGPDGVFDAVAYDREAQPPPPPPPPASPAASPAGDETSDAQEAGMPEWWQECHQLRITLLLNRAAAQLQTVGQGGNDSAEKDCDVVLSLDPANAKALFRRGQARNATRRFREAKDDLLAAAKLQVPPYSSRPPTHAGTTPSPPLPPVLCAVPPPQNTYKHTDNTYTRARARMCAAQGQQDSKRTQAG